MGCLFSKGSRSESSKKEYSWDKRGDVKLEDFMLDDLLDKKIIRLPGSIDGQQFIIQNCNSCQIYLLDHIATVTIENCSNCQLIIGPVKGSVFIRKSKNIKCLCACQQFRTRDCSKIDAFMCCTTQPVIESSYKMRFGCYQLWYEDLEEQFKKSGLDIMNNTWSTVYDFTSNPDANNWSIIPENQNISHLFDLIENDSVDSSVIASSVEEENKLNKSKLPPDFKITCDSHSSIVPLSRGIQYKNSEESCLFIIFQCDQSFQYAMNVIQRAQESTVDLVLSKRAAISRDNAIKIFGKSKEDHVKAVEKGPIIGLEFNGNNCISICKNILKSLPEEIMVYISPDSESAIRDINTFYSDADMQMR